MIRVNLDKEIIISEKATYFGDKQLLNTQVSTIAKFANDVGASTYLGMSRADLNLVSHILSIKGVETLKVSPITLSSGIRGAIVGTMLVLVNPGRCEFAYTTVISPDMKLVGNINLSDKDKKEMDEYVNDTSEVKALNISIRKTGDMITIYRPENSNNVVFEGHFNDAVFNPIDSDGTWSLGSLIMDTELKDMLIATIDAEFGYKEKKFKNFELPIKSYDRTYVSVNELFASIRAANSEFNTEAQAGNKNIGVYFWDTFYTKLSLLKNRGYDIEEVFNSLNKYYDLCKSKNLKPID